MHDRIDILIHELDRFEPTPYVLNDLVAVWRSWGLDVRVQRDASAWGGPGVGLMHVDLTRVPRRHAQAASAYRRCLNGRVLDISKRVISGQIVRRGDGYTGPVIVKTNLNYAGGKELEHAVRRPFGFLAKARNRLPWVFRSALGKKEYPVFVSPAKVPWLVWLNPDLVAERFLPETRDDGRFHVRTWFFLGDRDICVKYVMKRPVAVGSDIEGLSLEDSVPELIRRRRHELGFDYGKFDYAIHDGVPVLFDVNKTPSAGKLRTHPDFPGLMRHLAEGIRPWLDGASAPRHGPSTPGSVRAD
ncbi:MAG: hypothetical protein HBSAPP03_22550 [Phycisphaerae bacterium]|nr:MAG: hypothetical protein HBSAPP03_22550 [Phycisphaerae bacterium]